jgi:hypothetical protein
MPLRLNLLLRRAAVALLPVLLLGCGGDDGTDDCSTISQETALRSYMGDWYFWYRLSPSPDPAGYASLDDYFNALLYTGTDADFPADRWSYMQSSESFNLFFGDGKSLGYGISVAGLEVEGQPDQPLRVRYIEPLSDAAAKGVVRGDQVLSINGRSAADIITANDYSALTPTASGQTLTLQLRNAGGDRTVTVTSSVFALTPVSTSAVVTSPLGRKMGYVVIKDMINPVLSPLDAAFASFKTAGITEVVLDLRYNGGGLVSVGSGVASYVAGALGNGHTYASLLYNDKHTGSNENFRFASYAAAAGVSRVFVLTGQRTCSASEQVINGLRGIGIDVVAIGDTTCGKPVGFLPTQACSTTYSVVNFESVNERSEGRYFDGFAPTCAVAEDLSQPLGAPAEPLLLAARAYADSGTCPMVRMPLARPKAQSPGAWRATGRHAAEPGQFTGMIPR